MTVPADLTDDESLLRGIWPEQHLTTVDEGDAGGVVLNHGALRWDSDGVSVFRGTVLEALGLDTSVIASGPYTGIATTTKSQVEGFEIDGARHFVAVASPIDQTPSEPRDPAHASIMVKADHGLSNTKLKKAKHKLAREVFVVTTNNESAA